MSNRLVISVTIHSLSAIIDSKSSAISEGLYSSDILPVHGYSATICATGWRRGIGAATGIGMKLLRNGFSAVSSGNSEELVEISRNLLLTSIPKMNAAIPLRSFWMAVVNAALAWPGNLVAAETSMCVLL